MKKTMAVLLVLGASCMAAGGVNAQIRVVPASSEPYCREFTQTVTIGGKTQNGYGTACLQPDGSWEIQTPAEVRPKAPVTVVENAPTIRYVVQKERVFIVPPRPFVVGTILLGGKPHRFDDDFRPRWSPESHMRHGHGNSHGGHR